MKIINFSAYDRPQGASTRSFDIARGLARLGHNLTFVTNDFCHFERKFLGDSPCSVDGVKCDYLRTPSYSGTVSRLYNALVNAYRIFTYRKDSGLDYVIAPSVPITSAFAAYFYAKTNKSKFIFEIRDVWPEALVLLGGLSRLNPLYWVFLWIEIFLYRNSDLIISALPNVSQHVLNVNPSAIIHYVPNPISNDIFSQKKIRNISIHQDNGCPRVAYIGGFGIVHDIDTLLKAAHYYVSEISNNIEFVFYGDGLKWASASKMVRDWGLGDKINLVGYVPKREAFVEAKKYGVLIAAIPDSPIFEFGINLNKLYLYIAAGVPVAFAGNVPKDIVVENNFGLSVPAENHIGLARSVHQLLNLDDQERISIRRRMYEYVDENLSERAVSLRYHEILSQHNLAMEI